MLNVLSKQNYDDNKKILPFKYQTIWDIILPVPSFPIFAVMEAIWSLLGVPCPDIKSRHNSRRVATAIMFAIFPLPL